MITIKMIIISTFLLILLSACKTQNNSEKELISVSTEKFQELTKTQSDAIILDVRTPEEFAQGHLENAININYYDKTFNESINNLDKDTTYLIYCRSGHRSGKTLETMKKMDFEKVYNLKNGINDWKKKNYPVMLP